MKFLYSILLPVLSFFFIACGGETTVIPSSTITIIEVSPANSNAGVGATVIYHAAGVSIDGNKTDITAMVDWNSSNTSIATVTIDGTATALSKGNTTISAMFNNITESTLLTVTDATLETISVTPSDSNITVGGTLQFSATGNYSDGSTQELTSSVLWNTSNIVIAAIDTNGSVNTFTSGTVTISAKLNDINGSTLLTVN